MVEDVSFLACKYCLFTKFLSKFHVVAVYSLLFDLHCGSDLHQNKRSMLKSRPSVLWSPLSPKGSPNGKYQAVSRASANSMLPAHTSIRVDLWLCVGGQHCPRWQCVWRLIKSVSSKSQCIPLILNVWELSLASRHTRTALLWLHHLLMRGMRSLRNWVHGLGERWPCWCNNWYCWL